MNLCIIDFLTIILMPFLQNYYRLIFVPEYRGLSLRYHL